MNHVLRSKQKNKLINVRKEVKAKWDLVDEHSDKTYPFFRDKISPNVDEYSALLTAASYSSENLFTYLNKKLGFNIRDLSLGGRNCFLVAAAHGRINVMRYLNTEYSKLKNSKDNDNDTALTLAVQFAELETVQFLVEKIELDINEIDLRGRNCFLIAAERGKIKIMRYLNFRNSELKNSKDNDYETALTLAVRFADFETVKFLIEEIEIDINQTGRNGRNCFLEAAYEKKNDIMRYLNSRNSGLKNAKDDYNNTALTLAVHSADTATVQFLIEEIQVEINETAFKGRNCFLLAAEEGNIEMMSYLNSKNSELKNGKDNNNDTALHLAVIYADLEIVQFLIEEIKVKINETDYKGRNCFLLAAEDGEIDMMRYLNSQNSELKNSKDSNHDTALMLAVKYSDVETVQFLIEEIEMDINETGWNGRNCFHTAAVQRKSETMRYLNSRNPALKYHKDDLNNTVFDFLRPIFEDDAITESFLKSLSDNN